MEARALSTRLARLAAVAHLPRRGRNKLRIRRALIVAGKPLSTVELARIIYRTTRLKHWHTYSTRRAAVKVARPVGRRRSCDLPIIWAFSVGNPVVEAEPSERSRRKCVVFAYSQQDCVTAALPLGAPNRRFSRNV